MESPAKNRSSRDYVVFIGFTALSFAAFMVLLFFLVYVGSRNQMRESMLTQARALFDSIIIARRWNANLGGVYALKTDQVQSNPYLDHPDIMTADGRVLTLKNPALMVVEISKYSQERLFSYRMVGDRPLNPRNAPDALEREALDAFRAGAAEFWRMERPTSTPDARATLRYMAPLRVEQSCLSCHARQGYRLGDIKGAISVRLDMEDTLARHRRWFQVASSAVICASALLLSLILLYFHRLRRKIAQAQDLTERLANTDALTGVPNRRHLMARLQEELARAGRAGKILACAILDVDHFKRVNDTLGHQMGDTVLVALANIVREAVRDYDVLGRFGGEEFMLVLPETGLTEAVELAGRVRRSVRERLSAAAGISLPDPVTVSLGVSALRPGDNLETLIKRADDALYRAKQGGRDRVEREE